jgi:prepilin-type processing-associated H-X9-DG protein
MPIPLDERKKPASLKVHVSTGEGVEVVWADGHVSRYTFPYLRDNCPCASCNDEREKKATAGSTASAFPMFKPRITAKTAKAVGNYAIQIDYSDGHATGIYSFVHLREICPCEACQREFGAAVKQTST